MMNDTAPQTKHQVFVSHNKADSALGEWIVTELRRILGGKETVWYDALGGRYSSKSGIRPGDDWQKEIADNIRRCNVFLLLWSRYSKNADWVRYEVTLAKSRHVKGYLKILPICIDGCNLPFELEHVQFVSYTAGEDYQNVLDGVLRLLKLPPEISDPRTRAVKQAIFEIEEALKNEEWQLVTQLCQKFSALYPEAVSAKLYYINALTLLEQNHVSQAQASLNQGLVFDTDERAGMLLHRYSNALKKRQLWKDVWELVDRAIRKFPLDSFWYPLREQAYTALSKMTPASSPTVPFNSSSHFTTNIGLSKNEAPFFPLGRQQPSPSLNTVSPLSEEPFVIASIDRDSALHSSNHTDTNSDTPNRETAQLQDASDLSPLVTKMLSSEELGLDQNAGTWQRVNTFTEHYLPHQRLDELWRTPLLILLLLFDLVLLRPVFSVWPFPTWMIWVSTAGVLLILALGKMAGRQALGLLLALVAGLLWWAAGYSLGSYFNHLFALSSDSASTTWLEAVCSILCAALGFSWHQRLFRKRN